MKRFVAALCCILLALSLSACMTDADINTAETASNAQPVTDLPHDDDAIPGGQTVPSGDDSTDGAFAACLKEVQETCQPGTAGAALKGILAAAKLLASDAANRLSESELIAEAKAFFETLDTEQAELFVTEQLPALYETAKELVGEKAAELLDSAGYDGEAVTIGLERVKTVFRAIYEAVGAQFPND